MLNLNFSNLAPRGLNLDLAATISPRAESWDNDLNFCQTTPVSLVFNLAGSASGSSDAPVLVTGALFAATKLGFSATGQTGVQGCLAATSDMPTAALSGEYDSNVFRGLSKNVQSLHQAETTRLQTFFCGPWQEPDFWRPARSGAWQNGDSLPAEVSLCIGNLNRLERTICPQSDPATPLTLNTRAHYLRCWPHHRQWQARYQPAPAIALNRSLAYVLCWPLAFENCAPYTPGREVGFDHFDHWYDARSQPRNTCSNWQPTQAPPFIWPLPLPPDPPSEPLFTGDPNLNLVCLLPDPIWGGVTFNLGHAEICRQALPVGWLPPGFIPRRVIIVTHDLWIKLLSDDSLLPCTDIGLSIDRDAWGWSWTANLPERRPELLTSQHEVEISIDGYLWRGIIENMSGSRQHGQTGYKIGGRSLAAALSAPFTAPRNRTETADRTAIQLAEAELLNTGWTLDWQAVDWLVNSGCFSYADLTPIGAIKKISKSIDAIVQADRVNQVLTVRPRYGVSPWNLNATTPDIVIPLDVVSAEAITWNPRSLMNGVWVSGQSQGVRVRAYRSGSDGAPYSQMVVDPLITTAAAGRERGRSILAATGSRRDVTLTMPLLPEIGVFSPGMIAEFQDTPSWRGYIDAVNISADRIRVTQTAVLEHVLEV